MKKLLLILLIGLPFLGFGQAVVQQRKTPSSTGTQWFDYYSTRVNGYFGLPNGNNAALNGADTTKSGWGFIQWSDSTLMVWSHVYQKFIAIGGSGGGSSSTYFNGRFFGGLGTAPSPLTVRYRNGIQSLSAGLGLGGTLDTLTYVRNNGNIFKMDSLQVLNAPVNGNDVLRKADSAIYGNTIDTAVFVRKLPNGDVYIDGKLYPLKGFQSDSSSFITQTAGSVQAALTVTNSNLNGQALQVTGSSMFNGFTEYQQAVQFDNNAEFEKDAIFYLPSASSGRIEYYFNPSSIYSILFSPIDSALHYTHNAVSTSGNRLATIDDITGGGGTVTSVSASGSNGIGVSGSPITTSGTLALSLGNITPTSISTIVKPSTTFQTAAGTAGTDSVVVKNALGLRAISPTYYATSSSLSGYVPTSTTVAGFPLSSNVTLSALTATDATLTFSGSYDGSAARTVGINLANANTWTGKITSQLTTEQLRLAYDGSNYTTFTTGSTGNFTINPTGGNVTSLVGIDFSGVSTASAQLRLFRLTNTSGSVGIAMFRGNGTTTSQTFLGANTNSYINGSTGNVTIGSTTTAGSSLGVAGGVSIGSTSFTSAAPTDGLLVQGRALFGTTTDDGASSVQIAKTVATTPADGFKLLAGTAAALGAQQYSPGSNWQANGWGTTAGTSQALNWRAYATATQSTVPTSTWNLDYSVNGGAYSQLLQVSSSGGLSVNGGGGTISAGPYNGNISALATTSTDGGVFSNRTAATVGVPVQYSPRIRIGGRVWNTTATAASNEYDFGIESRGVSGTTPTAKLYWMSSLVTNTTPSFTDRMSLDNSGLLSVTHLSSITSAPTISGGTGAGTSPTVTVSGTDLGHQVNVTTGTSPATSATVATVTFNVAYGAAPKVIQLTPANSVTAALNGTAQIYVDAASTTTTVYVIKVGSGGLAASTAYSWYATVIQ